MTSVTAVIQRLTALYPLLEPRSPLPALLEELIRRWRQYPVKSAHFPMIQALLAEVQQQPALAETLLEIMRLPEVEMDSRLLAAMLLAFSSLAPMNIQPASINNSFLLAILRFTDATATPWYLDELSQCLTLNEMPTEYQTNVLPSPLLTICVMKTLHEQCLSPALFRSAVLQQHVLHPLVARHRPFRQLHRLLDYLGLSNEPFVQLRFRALVAEVWPTATLKNWQHWYWITRHPAEQLEFLLQQAASEELTLPLLYAIKYALFPSSYNQATRMTLTNTTLNVLFHCLRHELHQALPSFPGGQAAWKWLRSSNVGAAKIAYTEPGWWTPWLQTGFPAVREVLGWLQQLPLPAGTISRNTWLEEHLVADYRQICANLLLAQAAVGNSLENITQLAREQHLPAIRALGLVTDAGEEIIDLLSSLKKRGSKPVSNAALAALQQLALRRGLPGVQEIERQHFLSSVWNLGPLDDECVRVGWREGPYRMRVSLHQGKARLEVIGLFGPETHIPAQLRQSATYREARQAQQAVQQQYNRFKLHCEQMMLEGQPISSGEFRYLLDNPIFAQLAERLLWQLADGTTFIWVAPGNWRTIDEEMVDVNDKNALFSLTIAHPITLSQQQQLTAWQMYAADRRLVQPFRQLFREIYHPYEEPGVQCQRFAGMPIDPRRAYAILRAAGFAPGSGVASREWMPRITAYIEWAACCVSHDLFGAQRKAEVRTGTIWFTHDRQIIEPPEIDPIIFSETMRVADLLTTRSAAGAAELTSQETIALRVALLREMARSFNLTGLITPEHGHHAIVFGQLATYRVNLATGTTMLEPEGSQIILPPSPSPWSPIEGDKITNSIIATIITLIHDNEIMDISFRAQLSK